MVSATVEVVDDGEVVGIVVDDIIWIVVVVDICAAVVVAKQQGGLNTAGKLQLAVEAGP